MRVWWMWFVIACSAPATPVSPAAAPPQPPAPVAPPPPAPVETAPVAAEPPVDAPLESMAFEGKTFKRGDRVRVRERAGAVKPEESRHSKEIAMGPGQVGTFLGGKQLEKYGMLVDVAVVRWDAQTWQEYVTATDLAVTGKPYSGDELVELNKKAAASGGRVELKSFVSSLNVGYLEHVR